MSNKKSIKILAILIVFIFVANFLANKFYWYYSVWYFDMIMHTFGGMWLGFAAQYLYKVRDLSTHTILKVLLGVLFVGVGWEVFEIIFNNIIAGSAFNTLDTCSDVFFDLTGGCLALLYVYRRGMLVNENKVHPVVEL